MKILFLTYDLPYPLDQGGKIRAYHLLKNLAKKHQITLFSFIRRPEQRKEKQALTPFCQKIALFPRMKVFSPAHFLTALRPNLPFPAALYWSAELKHRLRTEVQTGDYDLIHFESFYTSLYLDSEIKTPQVLGTENIEWRVYQDYALNQKLALFKYPMLLESRRVKSFEEKTWRKADLCLAVSQENSQEISQVSGKKVPLVPNGVDLDFFRFQPAVNRQAKTILFVGNFSYIQNQDAVRFLVKEIFPFIKKKEKKTRLLIVGRNPTPEIKKYASPDIEIKSDVADIREAYAQADLLLAPIRAGSGTKFKILEAMASGVPVITTSLGMEGIKGKKGQAVIIADDPLKLAQETISLLTDSRRRRRLVQAGRRLVVSGYTWQKITHQLEKVYQELVYGKKT